MHFPTLLITGGAGFIGSAVIRHILRNSDCTVVNLDKLTYAGNLDNLKEIEGNSNYHFEKVDICDEDSIENIFRRYQPDAIMHLAAESHVDRSIMGPGEFLRTNIIGTYTLLEVARKHKISKPQFRFHHISTDEVFGDLEGTEDLFTEQTPYNPSSPYSASKASSDHLVRAWHRTYGLDTVITNCSNNYGPFHFPEKLIPLTILNAIQGKPLPVYGNGMQIRDWLYVEDHAEALYTVLMKGKSGETYNIGGFNEQKNIDVVNTICLILDELIPDSRYKPHSNLIQYVTDRPGHDKRYAIDATKIQTELGWTPRETFETGIRKTVQWYLDNQWWWDKAI